MANIVAINWAILLADFAVLIYLGWRSSRLVRDDDEAGFLVAGRSLGPFVGAATIVAKTAASRPRITLFIASCPPRRDSSEESTQMSSSVLPSVPTHSWERERLKIQLEYARSPPGPNKVGSCSDLLTHKAVIVIRLLRICFIV